MTRLIDADALWTSVVQSRKETIIDDDVKISMGEFVKLLDNAPTVELFCSYLSDGEVKQPCVEAPCNHERPQGEWITREDMNFLDENKVWHFHFMCEKCGFIHDFVDGHMSQYKFCPSCGADMREREGSENV